VDGQFDFSDLKHVDLPNQEIEKLTLIDGDILFNRTNSKELVGKCAVFHAPGRFVFASYLIRIRADRSKTNPDYLAYLINSPVGRQQIDALSRQIIGQANINTEELRSLQLPTPPLPVQESIMKRVDSGNLDVMSERNAANDLSQTIVARIESMVLGTNFPIEV
jgi:type I restriction enzyme, S subunit